MSDSGITKLVSADEALLQHLVQAIRRAGGTTIAEHESTCVVYGMPRAAVELGVVDQSVPLPDIPAAIFEAVTRRPPIAP